MLLIVFCTFCFPLESWSFIYIFLQFLRFQSWIHSWDYQFLSELNYRTCIHIVEYICRTWYFILLMSSLRRFCLAIKRHSLVQCVLCVDLTCNMYHQYDFYHKLGTCTFSINIPVLLLWWNYCVQLPFLQKYLSISRALLFCCRTSHVHIFLCVGLP